MGDRDNLVLFRFEGRLDLTQGNDTPEFGSQRVYLGTECLQARVEGSDSIKEAKPNVNAPVGEGVTEVASV